MIPTADQPDFNPDVWHSWTPKLRHLRNLCQGFFQMPTPSPNIYVQSVGSAYRQELALSRRDAVTPSGNARGAGGRIRLPLPFVAGCLTERLSGRISSFALNDIVVVISIGSRNVAASVSVRENVSCSSTVVSDYSRLRLFRMRSERSMGAIAK